MATPLLVQHPEATATRLIDTTISVFGLPIHAVSMDATLERIDDIVKLGVPKYLISANLNYAMLASEDQELQLINQNAALVLADGMPLIWASRLQGTPLPERVTGADLLHKVVALAEKRDYRLFLLGGKPGIADRAAQKMMERHPQLQIVGIEVPPFRPLSEQEEAALCQTIRDSGAQIVIAALSQPMGEKWIARLHQHFGTALSFQIGASLNFAAGEVRRCPRWVGRLGFEWVFRLLMEPKRLMKRYWKNGIFLIRQCFKSVAQGTQQKAIT
jgi:N-acetylglucosaminyldiphosphoundecaprenol N-acetyl-beta-D-mannosaminyltransferase